ncbi:MAG TPA: hypothetical protein VMJ31_01445 [Methylocystis sp.]|nr:hypothetical protein [Methylocystis sp.]
MKSRASDCAKLAVHCGAEEWNTTTNRFVGVGTATALGRTAA